MTSTIAPQVSHSTLVPREHVHREALSEVYLTDIICDRYPNFRIGVHLPKSHSYYSDHLGVAAGRYDTLLFLECFRQASILIAHRHVDAGYDQSFIFNSGDLEVVSTGAASLRVGPGNGDLRARIVDEKKRDGSTVGITLEMAISLDGDLAVSMSMVIQWMPRPVWKRIRDSGRSKLGLEPYRPGIAPQPGREPHSPAIVLPAASVGRTLTRNVVVGAPRHTHEGHVELDVVVDEGHPSLFDHPLDHIPGAVIFEAVRQSGLVAADEFFGLSARRLEVTELAANFTRFGELDLPTTATVSLPSESTSGTVLFTVVIAQERVPIAECQVTFARSGRALPAHATPAHEVVR